MYFAEDVCDNLTVQSDRSLLPELVVAIEVQHKKWFGLGNDMATSQIRGVNSLALR
jgi:hypothetical protein